MLLLKRPWCELGVLFPMENGLSSYCFTTTGYSTVNKLYDWKYQRSFEVENAESWFTFTFRLVDTTPPSLIATEKYSGLTEDHATTQLEIWYVVSPNTHSVTPPPHLLLVLVLRVTEPTTVTHPSTRHPVYCLADRVTPTTVLRGTASCDVEFITATVLVIPSPRFSLIFLKYYISTLMKE